MMKRMKRKSVANAKAAALKKANEEFLNSNVLPSRIPVRLAVKGYPAGEHLAVTNDTEKLKKWNVTHQLTGRKVNREPFSTANAAYACAIELAMLPIPWDKMSETDMEYNHKIAGRYKDNVFEIMGRHEQAERDSRLRK